MFKCEKIMIFFKYFIFVILTEAITELVVKSELFFPLRAYLHKKGMDNGFFKWLHELIDCGYCFSVWAGWTVALFLVALDTILISKYFDWILVGLILHRLSNVLHFLIDRLRD